MKQLYFLLFLIFFCVQHSKCFAQIQAKKITSFSFSTLTGGTIILKAQLDNFTDTLNFIFDTGSGGISLDSSTVAALQLVPEKSDRIIKGIAGIRKLDFLYNHSLKFKKLTVDSLDFHINNYSILSSAYGVKIDGVIGLSFLRRYIVKVNYDNNVMEVYEPGFITYPKRGHLLKPNFAVLPTINIKLNKKDTAIENLIFDTGAGLNLLLTDDYVKDSCVLNPKRKVFTTQAEGLGGKKIMQTTVINKITVGPYKFRLVPTYIFKDEFNVINYPHTLGVIGNDILRRFNLIINYPSKEIYIKPNTHFFDDFDYSYTGLGLYQINEQIRIEDVVAGSPADKAGLKPDDIVFAIDNNFTNSMQTYKQALQSAGNTIKILILRNGEPITTTLYIEHLLH